MKTCNTCGHENFSDVLVCYRCGRRFGASVEPPFAEPVGLTPGRLSAPKWLRVLGWVNILMGVALPAIHFVLVHYMNVQELRAKGFSDDVTAPFVVSNWTHFCLGFFLIVAGIGLIRETLWGRALSIAWFGFAFVGVLVSAVCANVALLLAQAEWEQNHSIGYMQIEVWWFAPFSPGYAILLLVLMLVPRTKRWARGVRAERRGVPAEVAWASQEPPVSSLAVTSMILSMVPFLLLTQMAGLITGIIALCRIRRSAGRLGGKGYAWTGVIISSFILGGCGGLIGIGIVGSILDERKRAEQSETRWQEPTKSNESALYSGPKR